MTVVEFAIYEAKFIGQVLKKKDEDKGKKGKEVRDERPTVMTCGKIDADKESPYYGMRVCKVGETYRLSEGDWKKYGGSFDLKSRKKVDTKIIDDGESDEMANRASPAQIRERAAKRKAEEDKKIAAAQKAQAEADKTEREAKEALAGTRSDTKTVKKDAEEPKVEEPEEQEAEEEEKVEKPKRGGKKRK